jgi:CubicO group peptidase (beta-lactamase class C family)
MNPMKRAFVIIVLLLFAITTCAAAPQQEEVVSSTLEERITAAVTEAGQEGFSGVVLAELHGKVVATVAVGTRSDVDTQPNTDETLFEIASATKSLTAVTVLILAQQGKLSLDDPLQKHLPNVPENCNAITIRHLLQHTSGIPGSNVGPPTEDLAESVSIYLQGGPRSRPGTKFEYWNQGYALLSGIIASTSGGEYTDAIRKIVFQPIGMTKSCFTGDSMNLDENVAVGQSIRGQSRSALEPPYADSYGLQYRGMGGAVCNVTDLHKFVRSFRSDELLDVDSKHAMLQPGLGKYGLGWFVESIGETQRRVFHSGSVRGFLCSVAWYPDDDSSLIILSNSDNKTTFFPVESACRELLEAEFLTYPESQQFSREFIESIAGEYVLGGRIVRLTAAGVRIKVLFDWGGPKTAGVLEKRDGDKLYWATVTNESLELTPGPTEDGHVSSLTMMNAEYRRKSKPQ